MTAESESIIAATLANGGTCPITAEKVMKPESVKNVLSLMLSCGLYNYSGDFAFKVGLPGKSGVSGALILGITQCSKIGKKVPFQKYKKSIFAPEKSLKLTKILFFSVRILQLW